MYIYIYVYIYVYILQTDRQTHTLTVSLLAKAVSSELEATMTSAWKKQNSLINDH